MTSALVDDVRSLATSGTSKEVRKILKELYKLGGWSGRRTSSGHLFLIYKNGKSTTISSTPSDHRFIHKVMIPIRKAMQEG